MIQKIKTTPAEINMKKLTLEEQENKKLHNKTNNSDEKIK